MTEAVVDDAKVVAATEGEAKTEASEDAEAKDETEAKTETDAGPVEGAEEVTEGDGLSRTQRRRAAQKAKEAALVAEIKRLSELAAATERTKPVPDSLGPKPDRSKFDDEAEYTAALAAWTVEERITARQAKAYEDNTSTVRNDSAAKKMELFKERAMALTDRYPDIEAKVFNDTTLPMSATMAETIMDSEKGPEVAYYLSANRDVAQRIKSMPPLQAAREIGRLEATLSLPQPRKQTQAPPPPSTVSGSVKGATKSPENMTQAEYVKWRNNGGGERRTG